MMPINRHLGNFLLKWIFQQSKRKSPPHPKNSIKYETNWEFQKQAYGFLSLRSVELKPSAQKLCHKTPTLSTLYQKRNDISTCLKQDFFFFATRIIHLSNNCGSAALWYTGTPPPRSFLRGFCLVFSLPFSDNQSPKYDRPTKKYYIIKAQRERNTTPQNKNSLV